MMKIAGLLFVAMMAVAAGCHPKESTWQIVEAGIMNGNPISDTELVKLEGEPDLRLKVSELDDVKKRPLVIETELSRKVEWVYKHDLSDINNRVVLVPYDQSEVWIYRYYKPSHEMVVGFGMVRQGSAISEYFVVNSRKVVSRGIVHHK